MHPKVLGPEAWATVGKLTSAGILERWILAGGTGLSLQLGHRYSEDLDFFRVETFDPDHLVSELSPLGRIELQDRSKDTLHVLLDGLRLTFLRAQAPLLLEGISYRKLVIADPRDIAVMKLVAIGGRGSRKDFVDLYFYLQSGGTLENLFGLLRRRFSNVDYNEYHIRKSLCWFEEAESEPMPVMVRKVSWDDINPDYS